MSRLSTALLAAVLIVPAFSRAQGAGPTGTSSKPANPAGPATGVTAGGTPDAAAPGASSSGASAPAAGASGTGKDAPAPPRPSLSPAPLPGAPGQPAAASTELDPATRDLVRREVEKAKEEMRDEMRAEVQGAQSAREFMETSAAGERPRLEFLQLNGYLRVRGDLFDNLDLRRDPGPSGYSLFPRPLVDPDHRGTLTTANTRFRLEPTLNVSEQVRVLAQVDMLDNLVLGSTPQGLFARSDGVAFPLDVRTQVPPADGVNADRSSIVVKRAWAEVQTPVGLLSFGRMPSSWGLGILSHAGNGIDDDYGDSVDRLQFALTPLKTPLGQLVLVPMYEIVATGVTSQDLRVARGLGQPFDRDSSDDAKAYGVKILRMDTEEETKRKLERDETSSSFGLWYMYKSQAYAFPQWAASSTLPSTGQPVANDAGTGTTGSNDAVGTPVKREATAHVLDFWWKRQSRRFRFEGELVGLFGQIANAGTDVAPVGPVLLRQFGGNVQAGWKFADGKLTLGGELGMASGDRNPGFGNRPGRGPARCGVGTLGVRDCDVDGAQFDPGDGTLAHPADRVLDIRNFRFNPAYRVDLILWREVLQGVTDAAYLKPTVRYELIEGLAAQAAVVYSQAVYASSTPSGTHAPLGLELDLGLSYQSDDGFIAFLNYGLLQPLSGLGYENPEGRSLSRAHAIRSGIAVKF